MAADLPDFDPRVIERDLEARDLAGLVTAVKAVTRGTPTRVVVNDRLDVALACGASFVRVEGFVFAHVAAAQNAAPSATSGIPGSRQLAARNTAPTG